MGYDIHITRKESWFDDDESNEIKLTEWIDYVKSDAEMRLEGVAEAKTGSGDRVLYENSGLAVWSYSKNGRGNNYVWFDLRNGNVTVKNADRETKNKMIEIAGHLKAKVQGDDGEIYNEKEWIHEKPWWKVWK